MLSFHSRTMKMLLSASLLIASVFTLRSVAFPNFCPADTPNIGSCDANIQTQADFDFDKFHNEEGGNWNAVYGPNTNFIRNLNNLTIKIKHTGFGQYRDVLSYVTKNGEEGILADEILTNEGNGVCTATTIDDEEYKINVLKYVPGRYNFYYICNNDGSDQSTDYRFVLAHGKLTSAEIAEIRRLDKKYGFKGKLISIGLRLYG